ncbi:ribosomal RNA small subunit methyltransferase NEP1 [Caerostris extrusa]|uniref:18S rRNA (pseudouridine-N1)-methyltransferase n=1 Tax=Caerostris extrusa TaxID=172846 RepID=A0AAV4Q0L7_CAEEX|nr:ribosomal RNA small subunit methyltransferase NEP1 [Caerostris extrusa]
MSQKRAHEFVDHSSDEEEEKSKKNVPMHIKKQDKRLIIILEMANLETVKDHELLNSEDHISMLKKRKDGKLCRPDITHQCLLMLFDSPLNRAGLLQVFIHTEKNILIEINPQTRIPRTFKRFAALMVQLLFKLKKLDLLMRFYYVYLRIGCKKFCTSFSATKVVRPRELVPSDEPIAITVGAMAHGQVNADYAEETIAISQYPLSAAGTCSKTMYCI